MRCVHDSRSTAMDKKSLSRTARQRAPWLIILVPAFVWGITQAILIGYRARGENAPGGLSQVAIAVSVVTAIAALTAVFLLIAFRTGRVAERNLTARLPDAFIVRVAREDDLLLGLRTLTDIHVDLYALDNQVKTLFPLSLDASGVGVWSSDDNPVLIAELPWSSVQGSRMGVISRPGRESRAVMLEVRDADRLVTLPFIALPQLGSGVSYLGPALEALESEFRQRVKSKGPE